jgi:hypothetical protein
MARTVYGDYEMTFTAHAHLYLPDQVARFGPLHKISGFVFEGMIKHIKQFITGTRFVGQEILRRISGEKNMKSIAQEIDSSNPIYPIIRSYSNELNEKHDAFVSTELSSTTITI